MYLRCTLDVPSVYLRCTLGVRNTAIFLNYKVRIWFQALVYCNNNTHFGFTTYSRTPLVRINWDDESAGYAENTNNWIFFSKIGYIGRQTAVLHFVVPTF